MSNLDVVKPKIVSESKRTASSQSNHLAGDPTKINSPARPSPLQYPLLRILSNNPGRSPFLSRDFFR